jgi:hypothetical protein
LSKEINPPNNEDKSNTSNNFCIPEEKLPDLIDREMLTSPTTCLDHSALERLEHRIKKANELLLDLALTGDHGRETVIANPSLEKAFKKLIGIKISIKTLWPVNILLPINFLHYRKVSGVITLVGKDFISIKSIWGERFLPFHSICFITHDEKDTKSEEDGKVLSDIDPCERRELVLKFGKSVVNSPTLFNIFFGHYMRDILRNHIGQPIIIRTGKKRYTGTINEVKEDKLSLKTRKGLDEINFTEISIFSLPALKK